MAKKMIKAKIVQKNAYMCGIRRLRVKIQVKSTQAVPKESPFVIFYSFLLPNAKRLTIKVFLKVNLVSLTLVTRTVF